MSMPMIYSYSSETGEYTESRIARENPRRPGEAIMPASSTTTPPPSVGPSQVARWTGTAWQVVPDHRGVTYWTPEGEEVRIDDLDVELPEDAIPTGPAILGQVWDGERWSDPVLTLEEKRERAALRRDEFAAAAAGAGLITWAEATAWAAGNALPAEEQAAVLTLPVDQQDAMTFDLLARPLVWRTADSLIAMQAARGLSDDQVDQLFGIIE